MSMSCLRGGKATVGLLKLDALSIAASQLAPCLASVFNACQRVAALPRCWALCGITPIHKGGDTSDPGNYRGIAVGSLLAKLYACMLNELRNGLSSTSCARGDKRVSARIIVPPTRHSSFAPSSKRPKQISSHCTLALWTSRKHMILYRATCCGRSYSTLGCMGSFCRVFRHCMLMCPWLYSLREGCPRLFRALWGEAGVSTISNLVWYLH
jgi:hypothetical protein